MPTDQRIQERELFESERSFKLLVENVTDYALYMLDPSGIITSWNVGGHRIKGYTPAEIIGQHFSRFYTDADRASGKPARALKIAKEHGRYEEEGLRVRKDGSFFWASVIIDPIYEHGILVGYAKITRDITERREAAQKLERMQKQLADAQRLDALGQLTGGVAHDFNNLLMIISGSLLYMRKAAARDDKLQRAVKAIEAATERGASLTKQLLTFARRQSVNPEVVNLAERLEGMRDILDTASGSRIELEMQVEPEIWPIVVDHSELETALVNLVINARDAMASGGTIKLSGWNESVDRAEHQGDFVALEIADTGFGIPADIVDKVFEPFFTTKSVGKGTGLGLSQVHGFVYQAGGFIELSSELDKGTKVTLHLPRGIERRLEEPIEESAEVIGNGSVLLVEDNPDVAIVSADMLEQLGYTVRHVSSATAALTEIELNGIDVLFSDIVMPGQMDGIALARQARKLHPHLPILLTTGYSGTRQNEFPILRKPYRLEELSQALAALSPLP